MKCLLFSLSILLSVISLLIGSFLVLKPASAIEIQKKFYEKINWRVEPISMQKEIRNTKFMGSLLIIITLLVVAYILSLGKII